ncbi:GTPase Obg [compost metagenome]
MRYIDERTQRIAEEPAFAEAVAALDQQIEDEARARLQELDDARALRRTGVKSAAALEDEDDDFDDEEDDGDGPEIIYVR